MSADAGDQALKLNLIVTDTGSFARAAEYFLVFEDITLRNQRQMAILNDANSLSIRRLTSLNRVPADS